MSDRILEIVVLLIDYLDTEQEILPAIDDLAATLRTQGYTDTEISSAYDWLMDRYDISGEKHFSGFSRFSHSIRVLSIDERHALSSEAQGFLIRLQHLSLIDHEQLERILDRAIITATLPVTVEQIKEISAAVLFADPGLSDRIRSYEHDRDSSGFIN